jgi:hypothetical protein
MAAAFVPSASATLVPRSASATFETAGSSITEKERRLLSRRTERFVQAIRRDRWAEARHVGRMIAHRARLSPEQTCEILAIHLAMPMEILELALAMIWDAGAILETFGYSDILSFIAQLRRHMDAASPVPYIVALASRAVRLGAGAGAGSAGFGSSPGPAPPASPFADVVAHMLDRTGEDWPREVALICVFHGVELAASLVALNPGCLSVLPDDFEDALDDVIGELVGEARTDAERERAEMTRRAVRMGVICGGLPGDEDAESSEMGAEAEDVVAAEPSREGEAGVPKRRRVV